MSERDAEKHGDTNAGEGMIPELFWDCPGCRYRIDNEHKLFARHDFPCPRCEGYKLSQFKRIQR